MSVFEIALLLSTLLCSLVAGFLFAYAVVVMPGIKKFSDRDFIRAFQVTDRIIQDNQPLFILVWLGSAIAVIVTASTGLGTLQGMDFILLLAVTIVYLLGVQISTIVIHLPLNNKLQTHDVDNMSEAELGAARAAFEPRWNLSNRIRTVLACVVSILLILLVYRQ